MNVSFGSAYNVKVPWLGASKLSHDEGMVLLKTEIGQSLNKIDSNAKLNILDSHTLSIDSDTDRSNVMKTIVDGFYGLGELPFVDKIIGNETLKDIFECIQKISKKTIKTAATGNKPEEIDLKDLSRVLVA